MFPLGAAGGNKSPAATKKKRPVKLKERELSYTELAEMVRVETEKYPVLNGYHRLEAKSGALYPLNSMGLPYDWCISAERNGGGSYPSPVHALSVLYLMEANERMFRRVANNNRTTRREIARAC